MCSSDLFPSHDNRAYKSSVKGKNIFKIFSGFNPNEVITVNSYSLASFASVITKDIKNDIGIV